MNQPKKYPKTDEEWRRVFSGSYDGTIHDLAHYSQEPVIMERCSIYGTEHVGISLEAAQVMSNDIARLERKNANLRAKLNNARWLLCIAWFVAAVMIAARIGGWK